MPSQWSRDYPSIYSYKPDKRLLITFVGRTYDIYWRGILLASVTTTLKLAKERAFELVGERLRG